MLAAAMLSLFSSSAEAAEVALQYRPAADGLQLWWAPPAQPLASPAELRVEVSENLRDWRLHERVILAAGSTNGWAATLPASSAKSFFRLRANLAVQLVRAEAEETLGFGDLFNETLQRLGQITPEKLLELYPDRPDYLPALTWDPTTALYFAEYNSEPRPYTNQYGILVPTRDFRLTSQELDLFRTNGFVVASRISQTNFVDIYYDIFVRDLPVFVTADSILHAWFKSYEAILERLEELYLAPALRVVLDAMAEQIPPLAHDFGAGPLRSSIEDADYFLTVARSLLRGAIVPSTQGQDTLVDKTLRMIAKETARSLSIFGRGGETLFDFTQFKVRSHYTASQTLSRYFQAMMWCGRVDFRVAGNPNESSTRELGAALVLNAALQRSGQFESWSKIDRAIQALIGPKDSMDFHQMEGILRATKLHSLADIRSEADLAEIKRAIEDGNYGIQEIMGDFFISPLSADQVWLPRAFTVLGQRFTMDAWALGKTVFDRVLWDTDGVPGLEDKVIRRRASALDIAFAVLGNNVAGPDLVSRIQSSGGVQFRDGLSYQHNLAAARSVVEAQTEQGWHSTTYNGWLWALRQLSIPSTSAQFPEVMRTRAWAQRRMNTQLASWTQLRHASVLYAKQTYLPEYLCVYPAGFVEPVPAFWSELGKLVGNLGAVISQLPLRGEAEWQARGGFQASTNLQLEAVQTGQLAFLARFSTNIALLETLSQKELDQQPFSGVETSYLLDLVERRYDYFGMKKYSGWYPKLFYAGNEGRDEFTETLHFYSGKYPLDHDSAISTAIITDILTAGPDAMVGDPGAVLHQAVGNVHFMLVAVDNGPDRMVFGGPVYSHYEFDLPGVQRMNDQEWQAQVIRRAEPPAPEWTKSWLAPRP